MNKANYNYLLIFCSCMLLFTTAKAQPTIQWEKSLGGSAADAASSVKQTLDGGYIVVGSSYSNDGDVTANNGNSDYWLVKLDANGTIQWEKNYGGSGDDFASIVVQTYDKGYFIAGRTNSNDGDVGINLGGSDVWVLKTDSLGNIQWKNSYGGSSSEIVMDGQQTVDGGYVIASFTRSNDGDVTGNNGFDDYWILKIDSIGAIEWQKSLGGSQPDKAYSIQQTNDLGYIVAGVSTSNDGDVTGNNGVGDYWIVKLDGIGTIQWQKNYGGSSQDAAWSVVQTQDNGYIVAGNSGSLDGDVTGHHGGIAVDDYWVVKLDSLGNLLWEKSLGGSAVDQARDVKQLNDGGYVVLGTSASSDGDVSANYGNWDYWVVKIDSNGTIEWDKNLGGSSIETAWSIKQTIDNGFIIAGQSYSVDFDVSSNKGMGDFWVVKLNPTVGVDEVENNSSIIIFPNPTNGIFTINSTQQINTIEVFNTLGQAVYNKKITSNSTTIDLTLFPKGLYLVQLKTNTNIITKKIVYE